MGQSGQRSRPSGAARGGLGIVPGAPGASRVLPAVAGTFLGSYQTKTVGRRLVGVEGRINSRQRGALGLWVWTWPCVAHMLLPQAGRMGHGAANNLAQHRTAGWRGSWRHADTCGNRLWGEGSRRGWPRPTQTWASWSGDLSSGWLDIRSGTSGRKTKAWPLQGRKPGILSQRPKDQLCHARRLGRDRQRSPRKGVRGPGSPERPEAMRSPWVQGREEEEKLHWGLARRASGNFGTVTRLGARSKGLGEPGTDHQT